MGSRPPPGCWVPKQGPSPRPGRRIAQEAFEAYGKSSPLPALSHHPFPPGYVPSTKYGHRRKLARDTKHHAETWRLPPKGSSGWRSWGAEPIPWRRAGRPKGEPPPPPLQPSASPRACVVLASCLRHACNEGKTTWAPLPPPHTPAPPRVGDAGGGGEKRPPLEDKAAGWGGSGERVRDGPHDRACREHAPCKPQQGDHRGCERRVERATTGATRHAPPPPCRGTGAAPRACAVLASCLRHACNEGKTTSPPPPTHTSAPPRVGDEGREGRTAPPPPREQSDKVGRQRREGVGRTTRPCP